jgi:hypothetical protein
VATDKMIRSLAKELATLVALIDQEEAPKSGFLSNNQMETQRFIKSLEDAGSKKTNKKD